MYKLQREVEELRKQVEQQKNDDSLQKIRVNISITKETKQRLKNYARFYFLCTHIIARTM